MRKLFFVLLLGILLFVVGCGADTSTDEQKEPSKLCRVEIYSAQDNKLLTTIEEQEIINKLLETYEWEFVDNITEELVPEYKLVVYQEKTLLYGQDEDKERDYEIIETIMTFKDSSYIEASISESVVKNMKVAKDNLIYYYIMPDEVMNELKELVK